MSDFICSNCGAQYPKWMGQCTYCKEWNLIIPNTLTDVETDSRVEIVSLNKLIEVSKDLKRISSGFKEMDRVLGGGFVPGGVVLLSGDPGIGKSTLLLHIAEYIARKGKKVTYISAEESQSQIILRLRRLVGDRVLDLSDKLALISANNIDNIIPVIDQWNPEFVIFDSIQMLRTSKVNGIAGSVLQVREVSSHIVNYAKTNEIPCIIVGHVTKGGDIAGPKILEHIVDAVLYLQGERFRDMRILKSMKNRFGTVEEVGIFSMEESGLKEVTNPSQLFINELSKGQSGVSTIAIMEGSRPLLVEIQALCTKSYMTIPRRIANGFDNSRLQVLTAVITKKMLVDLSTYDIYVNVVGGLKVDDPSADLGLCSAIYSSYLNTALSSDTVFVGEVGLAGEIRTVAYQGERIREAERLGYKDAVVGSLFKTSKKFSTINIANISNISFLKSLYK